MSPLTFTAVGRKPIKAVQARVARQPADARLAVALARVRATVERLAAERIARTAVTPDARLEPPKTVSAPVTDPTDYMRPTSALTGLLIARLCQRSVRITMAICVCGVKREIEKKGK